MISLGIDASGQVAAVAIVRDSELLAELHLKLGQTHSETLLPACVSLLKQCGLSMEEIDLIGISKGPGSFTGLRIAAATGKGLALSRQIPVLGISTLEMIKENLSFMPEPIHVLLDARRGQVYTASYEGRQCINKERACSLEELLDYASSVPGKQIFMGDGAVRFKEEILRAIGAENVIFPNAGSILQRASSLAFLTEEKWLSGEREAFRLEYLRKPQAERQKEAGELRDFQVIEEKDTEAIGKTEDRLSAKNYPI